MERKEVCGVAAVRPKRSVIPFVLNVCSDSHTGHFSVAGTERQLSSPLERVGACYHLRRAVFIALQHAAAPLLLQHHCHDAANVGRIACRLPALSPVAA